MTAAQKQLSFVALVLSCFAVGVIALAWSPGDLQADDKQSFPKPTTDIQAAVASDLEPASAEDVARKVLQLQEDMGGSVVKNRVDLQNLNHSPSPLPTRTVPTRPIPPSAAPRTAYPPQSSQTWYPSGTSPKPKKVAVLREAAWQLDSTAHRFELLDLYERADELRVVAARLRRDARRMKQHTEAGEIAESHY